MPRHGKRLHLRAIAIQLNFPAPSFRAQKFARSVWHLERLFSYHFSQLNEYILDGSEHIFVDCGPHCGSQPYYQETTGTPCSRIDVGSFDLESFMAREAPERDAFATELVERALLEIARRVGADKKPIHEIAEKIRAGNYEALIPELFARLLLLDLRGVELQGGGTT